MLSDFGLYDDAAPYSGVLGGIKALWRDGYEFGFYDGIDGSPNGGTEQRITTPPFHQYKHNHSMKTTSSNEFKPFNLKSRLSNSW